MLTSGREHSTGLSCSSDERSSVISGHCLCVDVPKEETSFTYSISLCHKECNLRRVLSIVCARVFTGEGVFVLNGAVEDSATAEISRSQV